MGNFEQPNSTEIDPRLVEDMENIKRKLESVSNPDNVSSLSKLSGPEDQNMMNVCFNVIRKTVIPNFKEIEDSLRSILEKRPELHQEINALLSNSWVGYLAGADKEAEGLYLSGAIGNKGLENGKSKEGFDFVKRVESTITIAVEATERVLNNIK